MIVAKSKNNIIGVGNKIPWKLSADFLWFKQKTKKNTVIMGRKTWDSLPNKPLIDRTNIVLSKTKDKLDGAIVISNYDDLFDYMNNNCYDTEFYIIGGASLYNDFIHMCDNIYVTDINVIINGGVELVKFPIISEKLFNKKHLSSIIINKNNQYNAEIYKYTRI